MSEGNARIEQFRKMTEADPENALGHFSLGGELLKAGAAAEAVKSLRRVIQIDPHISKAYQLLGQALLQLGEKGEAVTILTAGVKEADARGENMPKIEMATLLRGLGAAVPETSAPAAAAPVGEGEVRCSRCGQVNPRMAHPPFSNSQGKLIQEKVCAKCWRDWIGMGTKVINELRLPLSDPQAQKVFDQHMREFLNL